MDVNAIKNIKKSVEKSSNKDELIAEFLYEMIEKEEKGIFGFRNVYMKKIEEFSQKWDDDNAV